MSEKFINNLEFYQESVELREGHQIYGSDGYKSEIKCLFGKIEKKQIKTTNNGFVEETLWLIKPLTQVVLLHWWEDGILEGFTERYILLIKK